MIDQWYEQEWDFLKKLKDACLPGKWAWDDNTILQDFYSRFISELRSQHNWQTKALDDTYIPVATIAEPASITGKEQNIPLPNIWVEDYKTFQNETIFVWDVRTEAWEFIPKEKYK